MLDPGEEITRRGLCWATVRRPHVPLLVAGRHQYEVVLTDRRLLLVSRRRRRLKSGDVILAKRFSSLTLGDTRQRIALLQQRIHTDAAEFVLEWRPRHRALGRELADAIVHA